jgi:hypothetical protein
MLKAKMLPMAKNILAIAFWTETYDFRLDVARTFDKFFSDFALHLERETMIFRRFRTP